MGALVRRHPDIRAHGITSAFKLIGRRMRDRPSYSQNDGQECPSYSSQSFLSVGLISKYGNLRRCPYDVSHIQLGLAALGIFQCQPDWNMQVGPAIHFVR
jgi:hypothetical protein